MLVLVPPHPVTRPGGDTIVAVVNVPVDVTTEGRGVQRRGGEGGRGSTSERPGRSLPDDAKMTATVMLVMARVVDSVARRPTPLAVCSVGEAAAIALAAAIPGGPAHDRKIAGTKKDHAPHGGPGSALGGGEFRFVESAHVRVPDPSGNDIPHEEVGKAAANGPAGVGLAGAGDTSRRNN